MHLIRRQTCRVCGSKALTPVITLGQQFLQGSFVKPGEMDPPLRQIELSIVRCDPTKDERACGLLQMEHTVPPAILYSNYWYRSGTNQTMRDHLKGIVTSALERNPIQKGLVLDIGCNDGTLLRAYPEAIEKFGVDPSNVAQSGKGNYTVVQDIFPSPELTKLIGGRKFDIITSIAMFYDLEDPVGFVKSIRDHLSENGVWIFEMSYMPLMLKQNSYDTICHEHLEYYHLAAIETILKLSGMKVIDATLNDINGGSIRCYATHHTSFQYKNEEASERLQNLRREEFDLELDTDKPFKHFQDRINVHREELNILLKKLKKEGKKIHIYGASTKGNTILQWCGIDHRIIDVAAERNPDKFGARTLGTDIPIVSEEESRKMKPDYYLVLPWHFQDEFIDREKETIKNGTSMIFPLPYVRIVTSKDLK